MDAYIKKIFSSDVIDTYHTSKVLLVGAGGIGCELLKDLILMNFGEIHILDLDTIDLSNLNRQFLFRQKDIKKSKALTAVEAVQHFNHASKLVAHHGNIMDTKSFPLSFFQQFDMIFDALDNLEARMYMNKISLFARTPLIESGTTGLRGQVQPIFPYLTECFACSPKSTPKEFAVCTIRSTPSKPVHCVTWAKNFLFPQLFGADEVANLPQKEDDDNPVDAKTLAQEANELLELKKTVQAAAKTGTADLTCVDTIVAKVFGEDIRRLLSMEELWKTRAKPTPLDYSKYKKTVHSVEDIESLKLSDQEVWSVLENLEIFAKATLRLTKRLGSGEEEIDFDKDDEDTLQFVASSANIRSSIFGIPLHSEFKIKQIAGNIIPAVATTNAIMAGFSSLSSLHFFSCGKDMAEAVPQTRMVFDSAASDRMMSSSRLLEPLGNCAHCSITRGIARVSELGSLTLGKFREALLEKYGYSDDVAIATSDSRLLYDYDFEDNLERPLGDFVKLDDVLLISDSDEKLDHIELILEAGDDGCVLPDLTIPPFREPEEEEEEDDEDDVIQDASVIIIDDDEEEAEADSKKRKAEDGGEEEASKKRKVEEEGNDDDDLVVLD